MAVSSIIPVKADTTGAAIPEPTGSRTDYTKILLDSSSAMVILYAATVGPRKDKVLVTNENRHIP